MIIVKSNYKSKPQTVPFQVMHISSRESLTSFQKFWILVPIIQLN